MLWFLFVYFVICVLAFFSVMWLVRNCYVSANVLSAFLTAAIPFVNLIVICMFVDKASSEITMNDVVENTSWLKKVNNWFVGDQK